MASRKYSVQSIVESLTGVDPVITVKTVVAPVAAKPAAGSETASTEAPPRPVATERRQDPPRVKGPARLRERKDIDPEKDAFVQQVVATFDARVVRVTDAPVRRGTVPENSEEG